MASKCISNQMHNMSPDTLAYLNWVLDLQCWNGDGEDECGILMHGRLISNEEDEGEDEGIILGLWNSPNRARRTH